MTAQIGSTIADSAPLHSDTAGDPRTQLALALKFEPSELRDFELADKAAGQMMGKLLTLLFCVLVFMMAGVNIWMISNASTVTDPQVPSGSAATNQHAVAPTTGH